MPRLRAGRARFGRPGVAGLVVTPGRERCPSRGLGRRIVPPSDSRVGPPLALESVVAGSQEAIQLVSPGWGAASTARVRPPSPTAVKALTARRSSQPTTCGLHKRKGRRAGPGRVPRWRIRSRYPLATSKQGRSQADHTRRMEDSPGARNARNSAAPLLCERSGGRFEPTCDATSSRKARSLGKKSAFLCKILAAAKN